VSDHPILVREALKPRRRLTSGPLLAILVAAVTATQWGCGAGDDSAGEDAAGSSVAVSDGPGLVEAEDFSRHWKPWTGDLDGMVERRIVRMLVATNSTDYFVDLGRQGGLTYEAGRLLEKKLNQRYKEGHLQIDVIFIPVTRDRLVPALLEGHGDVAAARLTITEKRLEEVDFSSPLSRAVNEVVVTGPGAPTIRSLEDLSGRPVHVRRSSSYFESLQSLNEELVGKGLDPVEIVPADERLETEDILEMTNAGVYPTTVADDYIADFWSQVLPDLTVHLDSPVRTDRRLGWAIRKNSPKLKVFLDEFARENRQGTLMGNILIKRYYENADRLRNPGNQRDRERFRSMVKLFRTYGERYDLDYLLLTAQGYQESGLDQSKRSPAGAIGVMQLLPSTARDKNVGVPNIETLEQNIHAGAKYVRFLLDHYFSDAPMDEVDRHLFAFAAYNAGPRRVAELRKKAERLGLDPNRWRGNVEVVAAQEIGRETVRYVANILKYYVAYRLIEEREEERSGARAAAA